MRSVNVEGTCLSFTQPGNLKSRTFEAALVNEATDRMIEDTSDYNLLPPLVVATALLKNASSFTLNPRICRSSTAHLCRLASYTFQLYIARPSPDEKLPLNFFAHYHSLIASC